MGDEGNSVTRAAGSGLCIPLLKRWAIDQTFEGMAESAVGGMAELLPDRRRGRLREADHALSLVMASR